MQKPQKKKEPKSESKERETENSHIPLPTQSLFRPPSFPSLPRLSQILPWQAWLAWAIDQFYMKVPEPDPWGSLNPERSDAAPVAGADATPVLRVSIGSPVRLPRGEAPRAEGDSLSSLSFVPSPTC